MTGQNPASARSVNRFKEFARTVIDHHLGSRPKKIKHEAQGITNFVFLAHHGREKFMIRISPDPAAINSFIKEQWSQIAAEKAGVPTAEILEVGVSVIPHPYMITRAVAGRSADVHPDGPKIIRELGRLAARINSVRTKGFGATFDWSKNLLSLNNSWSDYLKNEFRYQEKIERLKALKLINADQEKRLAHIFREASKLKPKPSLCHGDLRLKNVIVGDDGRIAAIIDWEKSTSNLAPHWELSLALHDLGIDDMQNLVEGYGLKTAKLTEALPLIKGFNMLNYVSEADRSVNEKDKAALERVRLRLSGAFDLFSI